MITFPPAATIDAATRALREALAHVQATTAPAREMAASAAAIYVSRGRCPWLDNKPKK